MKKKTILIIVALLVAGIVAAFFLAPLSAWKEGHLYNVGKDKISYSPETCTYLMYCFVFWKCQLLKETQVTSASFTFNGGNVGEIVVLPNA